MAVITKIETQKNKLHRVNIFLDGEFFCAMPEIICAKYNLTTNSNVSEDFLKSLYFEIDKETALNKAANYLNKGIKTESQIKTYLKKYGFDVIVTDFVIAKLKEYNYINDLNYALMYVNSYQKSWGKKKLEYNLKLKGIDKQIISQAINSIIDDEQIIFEIAKKFMSNKDNSFKNLKKLTQHLAYKGFEWEKINSVINKFKG